MTKSVMRFAVFSKNMPGAKEVAQKIHSLSLEWSGMLSEIYRQLDEIEAGVTGLNSIASTLALPSPHMTDRERVQLAVNTANQTASSLRQSIQKLRAFLST